MRNPVLDVLDFHLVTDTNVAFVPTAELDEDRKNLRVTLIEEETVRELIPAIKSGDLQQILDGAVDSIYVILGTLIEFGLAAHFKDAWDEVQRSNMSKVDPATGVIKREDGKVLKPATFSPADLLTTMLSVDNQLDVNLPLLLEGLPHDDGELPFSEEAAKNWLAAKLKSEDLRVNQLYFQLSHCKNWSQFRVMLYSYVVKSLEA